MYIRYCKTVAEIRIKFDGFSDDYNTWQSGKNVTQLHVHIIISRNPGATTTPLLDQVLRVSEKLAEP